MLTTEKDAVRLAACDLGELPIASVPLTIAVEPADVFRAVAAGARSRRLTRRTPDEPPAPPARDDDRAARSSAIRRACCRGRWSRVRRGARPGVLHARPRAPAHRASATSRRRSRRAPAAERRAIARGAFAHFGRLLFELLRFSTLVAGRDAGARRVRRRGARRGRRTRRARACCSSPAISATGNCRRWCTRCSSPPIGVLARALDNPRAERAARADPHSAPATRVIYRRGTIRRVMRHAAGRAGRRAC